MKNSINRANLASIRSIVYTVLTLVMLISAGTIAGTAKITAGMSAEVAAEFNKQLGIAPSPFTSIKLALMKNPYDKFSDIIDDKVSDKNSAGYQAKYHRRLMTNDESIISAKQRRFSECQKPLAIFVPFVKKAHILSTADEPFTKESIMEGYGIAYPLTAEEMKDGGDRATHIILEQGWKYRSGVKGEGEKHVETAFKACLDIPIALYYWQDNFDDDE